MSLFVAIVKRDISLAFRAGGAVLPVTFFVLVAALFPFVTGPDGALLARTGGGALWMAALLAALMPVDRLLSPDVEQGFLDQYHVRGAGDEMIAAAKCLAHWLTIGPPLLLALIPAAALLRLDGDALWHMALGLLLGTPGLAALGMMTSAMTLGLRGTGALSGLIMLPLAVPILIFGAGSMGPDYLGALKLLGAVSLLFVAIAPFATGAALRAVRS